VLLGISGKRGTGKDLLGAILVNQYGFQRLSFAANLKRLCQVMFHLSEEQTDGTLKEQPSEYVKTWVMGANGFEQPATYFTPREIMIATGQHFRRFDPLFWVKPVLREAEQYDRAVITDVRFRNEAEAIIESGGTLVRLERADSLNPYGPPLPDRSETELDSFPFDLLLGAEKNLTPRDLEAFAREIMQKLEGVPSATNAHHDA
jgi:hypothetical protein